MRLGAVALPRLPVTEWEQGRSHLSLIRWMQAPAQLEPDIEYRAQGAPALEGAWTTGRGAAGARIFGDVRRACADREGPS